MMNLYMEFELHPNENSEWRYSMSESVQEFLNDKRLFCHLFIIGVLLSIIFFMGVNCLVCLTYFDKNITYPGVRSWNKILV